MKKNKAIISNRENGKFYKEGVVTVYYIAQFPV